MLTTDTPGDDSKSETLKAPEPRVIGGLRFFSLRDLLNAPTKPERWLWDGLLAEDGLTIVAGPPKCGKSQLLRNLAFHVARGLPFLDRPVRKAPVVYIALEDKKATIITDFRLMGGDDTDAITIHSGAAWGQGNPAKWLLDTVAELKPGLLIIDTFQRFFGVVDLNDYAQVTRAFIAPLEIARQGKCHIIIVHHSVKGERSGAEAVLGSIAMTANVDTILQVRRLRSVAGDVTTIQTNGTRDGDGLDEPLTLVLDEKTKIFQLSDTEREQQKKHEEAVIVSIVSFVGNREVTESEIRKGVPGRIETIARLLRKAVADGRIVRSGAGKKGDPLLYRVTSDSDVGAQIAVVAGSQIAGTRKSK